ncbi:elongation factor P maturation arginine rhamnosyltransferase EarP [Uliginosibacterium flavum]|uniref:Protein-arginine rhamnosyltransferase n=1 Tax=Uliginosibacterium flavum TaxID=1396831 RepID=A0ABV2TI96_9RHOO
MPTLRCDIFCKVIDNYGDIGVCWRLARQLVAEHGLAVRLWVDDLAVFARLEARVDAHANSQAIAGVTICPWEAATHAEAADIVIEAFACDPPDAYISAMAARPQRPAWINLDYLTAEAWAAGSHGLPSPHPRLPLLKYFFFPGFTPDTGGLIREAALLADLQAFRLDRHAQQAFWSSMAVEPPPERVLKLSLFAYENAALPDLLDAWANGEREIFCAVTAGRHVPQVQAWAGASLRHGRLTLAFLPFLTQPDYDRLLAACDLNFVRGEDSFVRAQWANHPCVWHIYQQEEGAHLAKLAAFLDLYCAALSPAESQALRDLWQAWEDEAEAGAHWPAMLAALPALQTHSEQWTQNLVSHGDLASKLLIFCKNLLECPAL